MRSHRVAVGFEGWKWIALAWLHWMAGGRVMAQVDPESRDLLHLGYNQPLEGRGPMGAYAFYYHNHPGFMRTNLTLRLVVAPTYLDSELGIRRVAGPNTDLGVGLSGGGFADTYSEIRGGNFLRSESFSGHGGEASVSLYHLFNPTPGGREPRSPSEVPLQAVLRSAVHFSKYARDGDTSREFEIPDSRLSYHVRAGLRWGGREPLMDPPRAVEASIWYEGQFRLNPQQYGFDNDRELRAQNHLVWGRLLAAWEFKNFQRFEASVTAGHSFRADRLGAYRLGGALPLVAEFPLMLPGYYFQEISAERYVVLSGLYSMPFAFGKRWRFVGFGSTALVDYLPEMEQPGNWHTGLGGGLEYTSASGGWHLLAGYAHGMDAIRSDGRGSHNIGVLVQWDLERSRIPELPGAERLRQWVDPTTWRGFERIFRR